MDSSNETQILANKDKTITHEVNTGNILVTSHTLTSVTQREKLTNSKKLKSVINVSNTMRIVRNPDHVKLVTPSFTNNCELPTREISCG